MGFFTADLCDVFSNKTEVLGANFQSYGGNRKFKGEVITIKLDKTYFLLQPSTCTNLCLTIP